MNIRENKYIPAEDKDFFILLRIGLWQKVEEPLSDAPDWDYIYRLACEQTVQAIIADGIGLYMAEHPECTCTNYNLFLDQSAMIVRQNYKVNSVLAKLCTLLNENGIIYAVLKGQGIAQCYPKPMLRCSGDIDIFLNCENYYKAEALLQSYADRYEDKTNRQVTSNIFIDGIEIELHLDEFIALGEKTMQQFADLREQMFRDAHLRTITIAGANIPLAPVGFDCFYVFLHFYKHYRSGGLGIRQIIDWMMLIHTLAHDINREYLNTLLRQFGVEDKFRLFVQFAIRFLGCPTDPIFEADDTFRSTSLTLIWENCKNSGNFGYNGISYQDSFLKRSIMRFIKMMQWARTNYREEGLNVVPITLKRLFKHICIIPSKIKNS